MKSSNLDLLRAVAVLLVLGQHLLARFGPDPASVPRIGTFGVLIFFVHTSLVLMHSMYRSGLEGKLLFFNFYVRRIFRIYPLSVLAVLAAVALHLDSNVHGVPGLSHVASIGGGRIFSNLLLVQNVIKPGSIINVLWSLPLEVQMYIFLPVLFLWVRGKPTALRSLLILWVLAVAAAVARNWIDPRPGSLLSRMSLLEFVPNFLPGIIAFALPRVAKFGSYLWLPFILLLVALYAAFPTRWMGWGMCLLLGFAIPFFAEIGTPWLQIASKHIATYSYGIYLSHQFCIWLAADRLNSLPVPARVLVLIATLALLPVLLYHAIEKPMIDVGFRLAQTWQRRSIPPGQGTFVTCFH